MDLKEALGLNEDRVEDLVVERICEEMLHGRWDSEPDLRGNIDKAIAKQVGETIERMFDESVRPMVAEGVETICLQKTNKWGEQKGEPVTFREYLVDRARAYMVEEVDYHGKTKGEQRSYGFTAKQTRIAHMIDKHLHHSIEQAMKLALAKANKTIADGINATCKIKLQEIVAEMSKKK